MGVGVARLDANEHVPLQVVLARRHLGHDVLTSQEAGNASRAVPDEEVLSFARQERRAVLTLNRRHFVRLHGERPDHAGIVVCSFDPDFSGQAERISAALGAQAVLDGQLIRVDRPNR